MRPITIFLIVAAWCAAAVADPRMWGEQGVFVRQGIHMQWDGQSVSDDLGNTLVCWADAHDGSFDIYAQLLDTAGSLQWADGGVLVSAASATQDYPIACATDGGWIMAWVQKMGAIGMGNETGAVWVQKVDAHGNRVWSANEFNGLCLSCDDEQIFRNFGVKIVSDAAGGAIVVWRVYAGGELVLRSQRIDAAGTLWPQPLLIAETGIQADFRVAADGSGNMLLAWSTPFNYGDLYAAKITPDGQLPWGAEGVPVCIEPDRQEKPRICADGVGGCYIVWEDWRNVPSIDLYKQRLYASGQVFWSSNGTPLCSAILSQSECEITCSWNGSEPDGLIAVWKDARYGDPGPSICAQKFSTRGAELWTHTGIQLCEDAYPPIPSHRRESPRLISDGQGGLVCAWMDFSSRAGSRIYSRRVLGDSTLVWPQNGAIVVEDTFPHGTIISIAERSRLVFCKMSGDSGAGLVVQKLDFASGERMLGENGRMIRSDFTGKAGIPQIVTMSGGRVGIVWADERPANGDSELYYQIYDSAGNALKAPDGEQLIPENEGYLVIRQSGQALCSDGSGGFFCAYEDESGGTSTIRLQHVNAEGDIAGNMAGYPVFESEEQLQQQFPCCCPDNLGGCYVAWGGFSSSFIFDAYVMRLNANGIAAWTMPVRVSTSHAEERPYGIAADGNGNCVLLWTQGTAQYKAVSATSISNDGQVFWQTEIGDVNSYADRPMTFFANQYGVFLAWVGQREAWHDDDVFVQCIRYDGETIWDQNGTLVTAQTGSQREPAMFPTPDGGVYVVWEHERSNGLQDIYGQRLSPAGHLLWPDSGLAIAVTDNNERHPVIWADAEGNLLCIWEENGPNENTCVISGICLNPLGFPFDPWWISDGVISESGYEWNLDPVLAPMSDRSCVVAWRFEHGADELVDDLRAQLIQTSVTGVDDQPASDLPSEYSLSQNYPNPFNPRTRIEFALPRIEHVTLKVFDLLGRNVATLVDGRQDAGYHTADFETKTLASGLYYYRLEAGTFSKTRKMLLLK